MWSYLWRCEGEDCVGNLRPRWFRCDESSKPIFSLTFIDEAQKCLKIFYARVWTFFVKRILKSYSPSQKRTILHDTGGKLRESNKINLLFCSSPLASQVVRDFYFRLGLDIFLANEFPALWLCFMFSPSGMCI